MSGVCVCVFVMFTSVYVVFPLECVTSKVNMMAWVCKVNNIHIDCQGISAVCAWSLYCSYVTLVEGSCMY